jgi:ribulose-phosphate 3-epimerase
MDGQFVPNITIGHEVVASLKKYTSLPLDVHLMIKHPERQIEKFAKAGADIITVHIETSPHIHRTIQNIKELGKKAGVSLNPGTPLEAIAEVLPDVDLVLVMTVNPGFGGQSFIENMVDKIARLREVLDEQRFAAELEVDGGINLETAPRAVRAGGQVLVCGTSVFRSGKPIIESLHQLRESASLANEPG